MVKSKKDKVKQYIIDEQLLNDTIAVLKLAVHPGVVWDKITKLIQQLEQCKPVENDE